MARPISRTSAVATHWITIRTFATFLTFQSLKTYWFILDSKLIAWTFSFQLSNQHRNGLTLSHMPMHSCIYSINTHSGLIKCQIQCEMKGHMAAWAMFLTSGGSYRDGDDRTETGTEERHLSARGGPGHCPKCREDKSMIQTLLLPTRSSQSTGRGKYINKFSWR